MQQQEPLHTDHYFALSKPGEGLYKEKGSKFIGYAFPVKSADEIQSHLDDLKTKYHDARHFCYAFRFNPVKPEIRANDDGEPSNSAGVPIYNQILAKELWNTLVVVVRYFGGTKLGVSGLVRAYKEAASMAIDDATIIEEFLTEVIQIEFPYQYMNDVMRLIRDLELNIVKENMGLKAGYTLEVRKGDYHLLKEKLKPLHLLDIL